MNEVTWLQTLAALGLGIVAALAGGALGGAFVAHRGDLEKSLGAWMGSFYGPLGAVPGLVVGLVVVWLLRGGAS